MLSFFRTKVITIKRVNVMKELIDAFKDPQLLTSYIQVTMINGRGETEAGQDTGGVFRDTLSAFWFEFFEVCTNGEREKVPTLREDFKEKEWQAIGHILVKGYVQANYLPVKLSRAFLTEVLFGPEYVDKELLIESFLNYLSNDEKDLVSAALKGEMNEGQKDEWFDFLDTWHCKSAPTDHEGIHLLIHGLAYKELSQIPKFITLSWKEPCKFLKNLPEFHSKESVLATYLSRIPKSKQVIELLEASPENNAQRDTLAYLQRYIRGLEGDSLSKFLRFCTGGDVLCCPRITISFNTMTGAGRRIVAHTCGLILDVPTTYRSFPEFRKEFNSILNSGVWEMDFM